MSFKMQGGTALSGSLCDNCKYLKKLTHQNGSEIRNCAALEIKLKDDVATCDQYWFKGWEMLFEFREKAWLIEVSKSNKIGFVSPDKMTPEQAEKLWEV